MPCTALSDALRAMTLTVAGGDSLCTFRKMLFFRLALALALQPLRVEAAADFNCQEPAQSRGGWSRDKRDFCCMTLGLGCLHQEEPEVPTITYDCSSGVRASWTEDKKAWCCAHEEKCFVEMGAGFNFSCAAGTPWGLTEIEWCCMYHGLGCDASLTYDCADGQDANWTIPQRSYCCSQGPEHCKHASKPEAEGPGGCSVEWLTHATGQEWCCPGDPGCQWPNHLAIGVVSIMHVFLACACCSWYSRRRRQKKLEEQAGVFPAYAPGHEVQNLLSVGGIPPGLPPGTRLV